VDSLILEGRGEVKKGSGSLMREYCICIGGKSIWGKASRTLGAIRVFLDLSAVSPGFRGCKDEVRDPVNQDGCCLEVTIFCYPLAKGLGQPFTLFGFGEKADDCSNRFHVIRCHSLGVGMRLMSCVDTR